MRTSLLKLFLGFVVLLTCSSGFLFAMMECESDSLASSENKQTVGVLLKQENMPVTGDSHEPELGDIEEWKSVHRYLSKLIRRSGAQQRTSDYCSESGGLLESSSDVTEGAPCFICNGPYHKYRTIKVGKNGQDKLFIQPKQQTEVKEYEKWGGQSYIFFQKDFVMKMSRSDHQEYLLREANALNSIDSPYVINIMKCCLDSHGNDALLFTKRFSTDCDRKCYIQLTHQEIKLIIKAGLESLKYLQGIDVVHLDVRDVNLFLKRDETHCLTEVRLGDFGKAQMLGCETCHGRAYPSELTQYHLPWEVRVGQPDEMSDKSDSYSFGIFILETVVDSDANIFEKAVEKFENKYVKKWKLEPKSESHKKFIEIYDEVRNGEETYSSLQQLCVFTLWDHDLLFETIKDHPDLCEVGCLKQYWPTISSMVKGSPADRPSAVESLAELKSWFEGESDCLTCIIQTLSKR